MGATHTAFHFGLVLTALGFGFRHGVDWDHIAALTDITASQEAPRRSMWFATLYALGHALVVFALGFAAIVLAQRLPLRVDALMERLVGATLVVLGCYVFYAVARDGQAFRMRSRWILALRGARCAINRIHAQWGTTSRVLEIEHEHAHRADESHGAVGPTSTGAGRALRDRHPHRHVLAIPDDPFAEYAPRTAFGIGVIHGIGAETPTQVLIFATATGATGRGSGLVLLVAFLAGLLASNSAIACAGVFGFLGAAHNAKLYVVVSCVAAAFSLLVGSVFLLGGAAMLPAMLGG